jgi:putative ATP-dependent endonuclease of the OLD family
MKINTVKISNILSFPYIKKDENDPTKTIIFDTESEGNVNILIWPNGAGKSNFLLAINETIKCWLMKDYIYKPEIIINNEKEKFENVITANTIHTKRLFKHFWDTDKDSEICISIKLSNNDIENIWFAAKYKTHFQEMIKKYSSIKIDFKEIETEWLSQNRDIDILFKVDIEKKEINIDETNLSQKHLIALEYLKNIELIQICIMIQNDFLYPQDKIKFSPIKNTFGSVWLHRNFFWLPTKINPQGWNTYISEKNTLEYPPFIGYYLCLNKIRNIINNHSQENSSKQKEAKRYTAKEIEKILEKSEYYSNLKNIINKYFEKTLFVWQDQNDIYLHLLDNHGQIFNFEDLSDGEQSFLTIIFAIYGFDIKDWVIVIDEPEIHSHPQMQRRLIKFLQRISRNSWTQFIISTYSPLFINEWNISNVYKFWKIEWETIIKNPWKLSTDEWSLIQMLKFENASKIFFSKKIIMVEWETDWYFFEFYMNYLHTFKEWKDRLTNYEIININWKWWFKRWKNFLWKFWLESYFIWDWDNTVEFNILSQMDLNHYYQEAKKYYNSIKRSNWYIDRHYTRLVNTIKNSHPQRHQYIIKRIEALYSENVFILKKWDIETYLWIKEKWLEKTVKFCHRDFQRRLQDDFTKPHREELNEIIAKIFPIP